MDYLKIYRKGEIVKKEKKEEKYKLVDANKLRKIELTISIVVGVI